MRQKGFAPILIILLVLIALGGIYYFSNKKGSLSPAPTSTPNFAANWKTYMDNKTGVTFKYDKYYFIIDKWPEKFDAFKEAPIIFTGSPNYNSGSLERCNTNQLPLQNLCILPGENFKQSDYITGTELGGRPAILFFINTGNPTNDVLQVVQTTDISKIEIAIPIDGTGGQEIADKILSTFKFTQ